MRPLVAIPVINGVARTIHYDTQSDKNAVDGEMWFELDHPMPPLESSESIDASTFQDHDVSGKTMTAQEKEAVALLNEYTADANAQIVSRKAQWPPLHPESAESTVPTAATSDTAPGRLDTHDKIGNAAVDGHVGEQKLTATNKWNKNHDHRDMEPDDLITRPFSKPIEEDVKFEDEVESTGKQGDPTRHRLSAHHHHHRDAMPQHDSPLAPLSQEQQQKGFIIEQGHQIANDPSLEEVIVIDKNPDIVELAAQQEADPSFSGDPLLSIPAQPKILAEISDSPHEEHVSILKDDVVNKINTDSPRNNPLTFPDSLRTRGLVPSVVGAHHCTPQFCVNVSVSDDGQFATFHIERDMAHTGWIALGIGYAMTMADLIILWPTHAPNRGAVLSRRTTHAYIEPHLVGYDPHPSSDPLMSDRPSEASLYPPNEYILHNSHPLSVDLHGHPLISDASSSSSSSHSSSSKKKTVVTPATLFPQDPDGSKKFIVQFTRPIKTVNRAYKLTPGTEQDFCWAYCPKPVSPDTVQDPGAHITQHQSVGSFAMDVAANQPGLQDVIRRLKLEDEQEAAAEKERRKKEIEESNRKLANEQGKQLGGGDDTGLGDENEKGDGGSKRAQLSEANNSKMAWITTAGWQSSLTLQACSCLLAVAFMFFFR
ncbi:hypothetical protein EC968_003233 [Mortierella alpina]|nr:hypothetical protein EC968_003233 [Mortierella alpina]